MEQPQSKRLAIRPEWQGNRLSFMASVGTPDTSTATMEQSPLTQQVRPEVFEPKVVGLYKRLFREVDDDEKPEGFWRELFLLKPDVPRLRETLEDIDADFLLHTQHQPQQLVLHAVAHVKGGEAPADENALETLTVFFAVVLAKKYTNPSSDVIEVLAGLDDVDAVFTELVVCLDQAIKEGRSVEVRQKAVRAAIAVVAGGYQTALVSYFINRDFFPGLMKLVHLLENPLRASEPFMLTGLLANYNKFEVHNQYRTRFSDFVNDDIMSSIVDSVSWTCTLLRDRYVAIQDDTPAAWSIGGTLSYVGLGGLTGAKPVQPVLTEEQQRELLLEQPGLAAAILLTLYDFTMANKVFCHHFLTAPLPEKAQATPFSTFLSFNSYLYQHAYRTARASMYAYLTLLIFYILVEDPALAKLLCETSGPVRLCRQRPPHLPLPGGDRPYAAVMLDILTDGINHNLRKRLDTGFYLQSLMVLSKLLSFLAKSRTKLTYHWAELWRSLLSFARFLTTYSDDLKMLPRTTEMVQSLVELLSLALTTGESFLPDAAAYDDLFYKLVESGGALIKLRDAYGLSTDAEKKSHINTLIGVSKHYQELIDSERAKKEHLSPREVSKIIKQGYETLSLEARDGPDAAASGYREVEHRSMLKRIARVAVADAANLVSK
ncbi:uncharacterized protein LTR77_000355 [Saxophila tyrrhenica]|uniref:Armadillo-like helical domain-containing protein n=1 Tax=Saxophila tyrrhenica TaxID=1690608 RepID=A0AAV9PPL4_9PEZI|nr:hypothetical protein LTR77_000355 [Saxophila tyrrhenica]